jgi:hypothetical protein
VSVDLVVAVAAVDRVVAVVADHDVVAGAAGERAAGAAAESVRDLVVAPVAVDRHRHGVGVVVVDREAVVALAAVDDERPVERAEDGTVVGVHEAGRAGQDGLPVGAVVAERQVVVRVAPGLVLRDEQVQALRALAAIDDGAVLEADRRGLGRSRRQQRRCRDERGDQRLVHGADARGRGAPRHRGTP